MEREEIENKDQELIKKFRTIIHNKGKKPAPRAFPVWLIFFFIALILSSLLILRQQPEILVSTVPEIPSRVQPEKVPAAKPAANTGTVLTKTEPDSQKSLDSQASQKGHGLNISKAMPDAQKTMDPVSESVSEFSEAVSEAVSDLVPDLASDLVPAQETMTPETVQKPPDPLLSHPVPEKNSPEELSNQPDKSDMTSGIKIEKIISCSSVNNRQHSRPKLKFSLAQDAAPTVWMKVISKNPPFTLTHVYYFNERKYCEVPLAIRYPQMRTWSSVTFRSPDHIGRWRVEVLADKGTKLDQIEFTLVE